MEPIPSRPPPKAGRLWKKYRQEIPDTFPVAVDTDGRVGLGVPNLVIGTPSGRASSCRPSRPVGQISHGGSPGRAGVGVIGRLPSSIDDSCGEVRVAMPRDIGPGCAELIPTRFPGTHFLVSAFQHMGDRKTQEDRFTVVPHLDGDSRSACAFFGVWDGTVGDFASENVKDLFLPKLLEAPSWRQARTVSRVRQEEKERLLESAMKETYRSVDESLLARCAKNTQHYSTCTSVTLLMVGDLLVVGHLGDSRIVLGKSASSKDPSDARGEKLTGEQVTLDHKPDQEQERIRIEQCGGMVERLRNHANKPFIRGGDFLMRKALGEQPMQLQYSRAFGGKDLKMFGLSSVPDVRVIRIGTPQWKDVKYAILASDGLWDVVNAQNAVAIAHQAASTDQNPAEALVRVALLEQSRRKARADNVTAICIQFD